MSVAEGDHVERGKVVATLRLASQSAAGDADDVLDSAITAERSAAEAQKQDGIARARAQTSSAREKLIILRQELLEADARRDRETQKLAIAKATLAAYQGLSEKGFASKLSVEDKRGEVLSAEESLSTANSEILSLKQDIAEDEGLLAEGAVQERQAVDQSAVDAAAADEKAAALAERRGISILAPATGNITAVETSAGQSIDAGRPIAWLTPASTTLELQIFLPSGLVREVRVGDLVHFRVRGARGSDQPILARIRSIGGSAIPPGEVPLPGADFKEPTFAATAAIISGEGGTLATQDLLPGMIVNAAVELQRRSFLDWLFAAPGTS